VEAVQVHAADPPVDAVECDLVGLAGQHLPAEPVERLAKEPQLTKPRGGDGGQARGGGRAEGRPRAGGQLKCDWGQPRARARTRQLAQLPSGQVPQAAEAGDARVLRG
jgi:hypothetical protein